MQLALGFWVLYFGYCILGLGLSFGPWTVCHHARLVTAVNHGVNN